MLVSVHIMEESFLFSPQETFSTRQIQTCLEVQTANGVVQSTKEARVFYIQELGTHLYDKFVEVSHSVLSHGRLCDELEYSNSWQPVGNPMLMKGKKIITCCTDNFVPLVAVTQQKAAPCSRHDCARRTPSPRLRSGGNHAKIWTFSF